MQPGHLQVNREKETAGSYALNFDGNVSGFKKYYKIFILHPAHWSVSKETESLFIRKTTLTGSDIHIHKNQTRTIGNTSALFLPNTIVPIAEGFASGLFAFWAGRRTSCPHGFNLLDFQGLFVFLQAFWNGGCSMWNTGLSESG